MPCLEQASAALQAILLNLCRLFCRLLSIVLVFLCFLELITEQRLPIFAGQI